MRVAVNFSADQLQDSGIADKVATALNRFGLPADDLVVEITESVWLDPQSAAIDNLHRLKRLGVRLAIDDFGTGYASLSYLKHLPVDILKVDRSFVTDLANVGVDAAIVRGIVSIAHKLDLEVIVEGVETETQCELLRDMGCDLVQGHLLGRGLPPTAFTEAHFGKPPGSEPFPPYRR
ncbi:EAL domain-containing protein [Aromatoleum anaerobium]|nr:EAL domain-containing protein [Aromatoleum anaerobium]